MIINFMPYGGGSGELPPVVPTEMMTFTVKTPPYFNGEANSDPVAVLTAIDFANTTDTELTIPYQTIIDGTTYPVALASYGVPSGTSYTVAFSNLGSIRKLVIPRFEIYTSNYSDTYNSYRIQFPSQITELTVDTLQPKAYGNTADASGQSYIKPAFSLPNSLETLNLPEGLILTTIRAQDFYNCTGNAVKTFWNTYCQGIGMVYGNRAFDSSNLYTDQSVEVNENLTIANCLDIRGTISNTYAFNKITAQNIVCRCSNVSYDYCFANLNVTNLVLTDAVGTLSSSEFRYSNITNLYILQSSTVVAKPSTWYAPNTLSHFYVPASLVDDYKTAWSNYSSIIEALPWEATE